MPDFTTPVAATVLAAALIPLPTRAQIPDEFTNLQVLAPTVERAELIETMRGFSLALGVRCSYCHTVSDGLDQPTDDFAADTKSTKERARAMMRMVGEINGVHLAGLPGRKSPAVGVSCRTCHSGVTRPEPLEDVLLRAVEERGGDALEAEYRRLHEQFYGRGTYDFGPRSLITVGERLFAGGAVAETLITFELVVGEWPDLAEGWMNLGGARAAAGDDSGAIVAYRRVTELTDGGGADVARRRIAELGGG